MSTLNIRYSEEPVPMLAPCRVILAGGAWQVAPEHRPAECAESGAGFEEEAMTGVLWCAVFLVAFVVGVSLAVAGLIFGRIYRDWAAMQRRHSKAQDGGKDAK